MNLVPGLVLLENLCYVRSWLRHVSEAESIPTGPRVTTTFFDGLRPVTVREPVDAETSMVVVNFTEDGTRADHTRYDDATGVTEAIDTLTLPNGRRTTGQVVRPHADRTSYEGGARVELDEEAPGVSIFIHVDGIGATTAQNRKTAPEFPDPTPILEVCFNTATSTFDYAPIYNLEMITVWQGTGRGAETTAPNAVTADPVNSTAGSLATIDDADESSVNASDGPCACRGNNPSAESVAGFIDPSVGMRYDLNFGNMGDLPTGVLQGQSFTPSGHPMETMERKGGGGSGGFRGGATGGAGGSGGGTLTPGRALPPSAGTSASPANSTGRATWSGPSGPGTSTHSGSGGVSGNSGGTSTGRSSLPARAPDPSVGSALGATGGVGPMYPGGCVVDGSKVATSSIATSPKTPEQSHRDAMATARDYVARAIQAENAGDVANAEIYRIIGEAHLGMAKALEETHGLNRPTGALAKLGGGGKPEPVTSTAGGGAGAKPPVQAPPNAGFPWDWHHLLPREYIDWFRDRGVNIHDHCVHLPSDVHRGYLHGGQGFGRGGRWNAEWRSFMKKNPNATPQQIIQNMRHLMQRHGVTGPVQPHPKLK